MKEVRGGNLVATIKTNLPHVGHVKLDTKGRKVFCIWRNIPFVISSRLAVKEKGFCKVHDTESEESAILQKKLRASVS